MRNPHTICVRFCLMSANVVLVIAGSSEPELSLLEPLGTNNTIITGDSPAAFDDRVSDANILLHWSGTRDFLRNVFLRAPKLQWVHSRSAGLDSMLFSQLIQSPLPLTHGTRGFRAFLGEFA